MSTYAKIRRSSRLIKEFLDAPITSLLDSSRGQADTRSIVENAGKVAQKVKRILGEKTNKDSLKKRR